VVVVVVVVQYELINVINRYKPNNEGSYLLASTT